MNTDIEEKGGTGNMIETKEKERALQVPLRVTNTWTTVGKTADRMPPRKLPQI